MPKQGYYSPSRVNALVHSDASSFIKRSNGAEKYPILIIGSEDEDILGVSGCEDGKELDNTKGVEAPECIGESVGESRIGLGGVSIMGEGEVESDATSVVRALPVAFVSMLRTGLSEPEGRGIVKSEWAN